MNKLLLTGSILLALLFLVWPVAHTTSVRELLLWSSLLLYAWLAWKSRPHEWVARLAAPFGLFAGLTLWLLVVAILISPETAWSLGEIRGQWLKGVAALLLGAAAGAAIYRDTAREGQVLTLVAVSLLLLAGFADSLALVGLFETGSMPTRFPVLGSGPDKANYVTNLLLTLLLAETLLRLAHGRTLLRFGNLTLALAFAVALLAEYVNGMRNGYAEFAVIFLFAGSLFIRARVRGISPPVLGASVAGLLVVVVGIGYASYHSDPRWQKTLDTIAIAWDTDSYRNWISPAASGDPALPDGSSVEGSAYFRVASLKEGSRLVMEHPLGVGYGRNAFGHGLKAKFGDTGLGHSHSGLLDLAVGSGLPGVALWLAFLGSLFVIGWRRYRAAPAYPPLLLLLLVTGYSARMLVDSVIRDHMLQQFLLLAGLLAVLSVARRPETPS